MEPRIGLSAQLLSRFHSLLTARLRDAYLAEHQTYGFTKRSHEAADNGSEEFLAGSAANGEDTEIGGDEPNVVEGDAGELRTPHKGHGP